MMIRKPAIAGRFYPNDASILANTVEHFLTDAQKSRDTSQPVPKVIIAPHAGYVYSGATAARAYAVIADVADSIKQVVLLGPSHHVAFKGIATPSVDAFQTPLGLVKINKKALEVLGRYPYVGVLDQAHEAEHSIEIHLPFLQTLLPDFELIPLVVGDTPPEQVAQALETVWGGPETLIVISSDLSHYHDYDTAQKLDHQTSTAIMEKRFNEIDPQGACGSRPIKGMLYTASKLGLAGTLIDVCNSGDTAGPKDRVVGYGAYHFGRLDMSDIVYTDAHKQALLTLARQSIAYGLEHGKMVEQAQFPSQFITQVLQASFVTLEINKQLRGCRGSLVAHKILPVDVMQNAFFSAFADPRFSALTQQEFEQVVIKISILTPASSMQFSSEEDLIKQLRPGVDGLWLIDGENRGTFLPSVWESIPQPKDFLRNLKVKAGLPPDHWSDTLQVKRYTTEYFGEA